MEGVLDSIRGCRLTYRSSAGCELEDQLDTEFNAAVRGKPKQPVYGCFSPWSKAG